jgi:hypothetical protein
MTSDHTLGDQPIEAKYLDQMNHVARELDLFFNGDARGRDRKVGFVLMVYNFNDDGRTDGRCNYISNGADRRDVVVLMKEMIRRFEGQPEIEGRA